MHEKLYQVGGSLLADSPTYIVRAADPTLYQALRSGEFCYVLNSRQMGKSSLRVQVMRRLQAEGVACASIDTTLIREQQVTARQWYGSLMRSLVTDLELGEFSLRQWWQEREELPAIQCFSEFVEQFLLVKISQSIVIFIDEIDSILNLDFKDDFFALIRAFYNKRSDCVDYRRLTFCLLGVATPRELIEDHARTPFNIGRAIDLCGFRLEEAQPLEKGLAAIADHPHIVLKAVLSWTGGQPFLTQKLCQLISDDRAYVASGQEEALVQKIVEQQIIESWEAQDHPEHLRTIRDRLLFGGEHRAGRLLGLCQQISKQGSIPIDNGIDQLELRLTGLIVRDRNQLKLYNRIYQRVFDSEWLAQELAKLRPYSVELEYWLASGMKDESRLLRGQALREAMAWSVGKRLNDEDYRFFGMSQDLELRDVKRKLAVEEEAKRILEEARQKAETELAIAHTELSQAKDATQEIVRQGRKVRLITSLIAVGMGCVAIAAGIYASREIQKAKQEAQIIQDASSTLRQFEQGKLSQIDASLMAIRTAQQSKALNVKNGYSVTNPVFTLQQILDKTLFQPDQYLELNRLAHSKLSCASYSPEGNITTVSKDGTAYLWNFQGQRLRQIKLTETNLVATSCSADGTRFATIARSGEVQIWDFRGNLLQTIKAESQRARVVSFSSDRNLLAIGTRDGWVKLWNLKGQKLKEFKAHQDYIYRINFSPDDQTLATASQDKTIKLWTVNGEKTQEFTNNDAAATDVVFSPDGTRFATAWNNGIAQVRSLDGKVIRSFKVAQNWIRSIRFTVDSQKLIIGLTSGNVQVWDLNGQLLQTLKGRPSDVSEIVVHPDGKSMMTVAIDDALHLWRMNTEQSQKFKRELKGHQDLVRTVSFHPNGQQFVTASPDLKARLWTIEGRQIRVFKGHTGEVYHAEFSPDGTAIATASKDRTVQLWNVKGQRLQTWQGFPDSVFRLRFSPDGTKIAIALRNGQVQLRSRQGEILKAWQAHQKAVSNLSFNHAGTQLATASDDQTAKLWNLDGQLLHECKGHAYLVLSVSFSPNDQQLITASADGTARLWTLQGQMIQEFRGSVGAVRDAQFSPDGTIIATASDDGIIRLWNLDGKQMQVFADHSDRVYGIRFSPDGSKLVSASGDRSIRIWSVGTVDRLIEQGCEWLRDYLMNNAEDSDRGICHLSAKSGTTQ